MHETGRRATARAVLRLRSRLVMVLLGSSRLQILSRPCSSVQKDAIASDMKQSDRLA